jgi:alpha-L-arabinofuranosidase
MTCPTPKACHSERSEEPLYFGLSLLLLLPFAACQRPPEPSITTISIGRDVLHTGVKRFGINLSGQSYYDSGQMLRNLTFHNPAFEGETWQSILRCKTVTPTTCTDENIYTVWPAGFLDGAHYELISGANKGSSGTIRTNSAVSPGQGITLTFAATPKPPSPGDFLLVRIEKPGDAQAGWWTNLDGGATLSTEFKDLSPNTPGRQALSVDASAPGQAAAIHSYFDSLQGHSFVQLHGTFTLSFRAKLLKGNKEVSIRIERLDTTHGIHTFFSRSISLTSDWHDYTFDFAAAEDGSAVGTVGLTFTFSGTSALLDDVALTAAAGPSNPTAFRDEVVQTLRELRPGVLRYMDNGTDFGSSLDNMLAPPFARRRAGASTQQTVQEDIPIGLHEFLTLSKAVGAEPWYSMPAGTSPVEAANLIEYLGGASSTRYGAIRAGLGQREPWTSVFPEIHLELGNEQWNHQSFAGATIADPAAYGQRAARVFEAMRASPAFRAAKFDLILGSWATVPWWSQQEMANSSGFDSIDAAPYIFNDFNDATSTEAIFGPMFAEPERIDSRPDGYMAQQARLLKSPGAPFIASLPHAMSGNTTSKAATNLAVYEVNLGSMTGSASVTQADIDRAIPSMGAGLAVADHMLLMLRDLGITTQCLFALPEYLNNFTAPGPKRMIPLWGAVVDMGGATNRRRPQFLAEQLANQAILPTMLATHLTGPAHTWNQPESPNGKIHLDNAHLLQTFAFADGGRRSLILLNLSRTETIPVAFSGTSKPSGSVEQVILTSTKITDSNESSQIVFPATKHFSKFDPAAPYPLQPFSMTVLTWNQ